MNTGAIPMPRIPIQMPASYQSFQQPTMPASLPSVEPPTLNTIPIPQSQPSTSAQAPPPSVQSLLGSKTRTRIVVPDESISLVCILTILLILFILGRKHGKSIGSSVASPLSLNRCVQQR